MKTIPPLPLCGILIVLALALLPHCTASAQQQAADSAEIVVGRYLDLLGTERLPADSVLFLQTEITFSRSTDTFLMRRWFLPPQMMRVEVWHKGRIQVGLCSNGQDRFRKYKQDLGYWVDIQPQRFYQDLSGYDFRGPLHGWQSQGATLEYGGRVSVEGGHKLLSVRVEAPEHYERYYLFEPTGLLAVIIETDNLDTAEYRDRQGSHIQWKCEHEYMPIGSSSLTPKEESFMRNGELTILRTSAAMLPKQTIIFNQDSSKP